VEQCRCLDIAIAVSPRNSSHLGAAMARQVRLLSLCMYVSGVPVRRILYFILYIQYGGGTVQYGGGGGGNGGTVRSRTV